MVFAQEARKEFAEQEKIKREELVEEAKRRMMMAEGCGCAPRQSRPTKQKAQPFGWAF